MLDKDTYYMSDLKTLSKRVANGVTHKSSLAEQ